MEYHLYEIHLLTCGEALALVREKELSDWYVSISLDAAIIDKPGEVRPDELMGCLYITKRQARHLLQNFTTTQMEDLGSRVRIVKMQKTPESMVDYWITQGVRK